MKWNLSLRALLMQSPKYKKTTTATLFIHYIERRTTKKLKNLIKHTLYISWIQNPIPRAF